MSDDMLVHFSSNSSNQSDQSLPTKIAKLEARMVGKGSSSASQQQGWSSVSSAGKFSGAVEDLVEPCTSMYVIIDEAVIYFVQNGGEFLIQANTRKRPKPENDTADVFERAELQSSVTSILMSSTIAITAVTDGRQTSLEAVETKNNAEASRKRSGRGRGSSGSGRGRGSKSNDQTRSQISPPTVSASNGQNENVLHKDGRIKDQVHNDNSASLEEEVSSLRARIVVLEEDLRKAKLETSENQNARQQLEMELKELKALEQQMKPKRTKIISDLLISVSKAERQEARLKVRQDSLRLGNVGVIRAGTIISETWEDGPALKDLNAQLKQLIESKEAIERQRKLFKKKQSDKGDGIEAEAGMLEMHEEIYKCRLASIKREEEIVLRERDRYELEKGRLIREMKRIRDEDGSRFNNFQILNHRYALLNLLGKGGFSEVYKAFDLVEHRYVACKLHGLNAQWSEEKKQSYIRHALREYNIHKTLVHPHIVRLWDIFEIDTNTFCTVLEYLPPECFELNKTPLISSKVDVWSAGILFYQMLFGRRPFGHDQTQERILREDTIIKARKVEFPSRPTVSNEAKVS
ncbi:hypothetical protein TSUD_250410 [Trifolium subterraneum]|nr:hypothetical protein TSUD_250410 [Trifolium subterraneum]